MRFSIRWRASAARSNSRPADLSGEDSFIQRHFAPLAGPGALDLRDDAAVIRPPPGCDLVVTTDAVVAGVHFFPDDPPGDIARKALRVNLSDLAAKGATPLGFLLTISLPPDIGDDFVASFAAALGDDASHYGCPLLGGDTVATPGPLTVSITAFGHVPSGAMVPRDGARDGDNLFVTGTIGDAALGLLVCKNDPRVASLAATHRDFLVDRYRNPQPRNILAGVVRHHATAAMDVSDGLAGDLAKMLGLAGLSAEIDASNVPLSPAASAAVEASPDLLATILSGGDDYEILCAIPDIRSAGFCQAAEDVGLAVTRIGRSGPGSGVRFTRRDGRTLPLDRLSYSHR